MCRNDDRIHSAVPLGVRRLAPPLASVLADSDGVRCAASGVGVNAGCVVEDVE